MKQNLFLQKYSKIIQYLYRLKLLYIFSCYYQDHGTTRIHSWKYNKSIENITKLDSNFAPTFGDHHLLPHINFNGHYLIKIIKNISIPKKVTNLYISHTLGPQIKNTNTDFTLNNCLFVKLTKNADPDKYKYNGYSIVFDSHSEFHLQMKAQKMLLFLELI